MIAYPTGWTTGPRANGGSGVKFVGPDTQQFVVGYENSQVDPTTAVNTACQAVNGTAGQATTVSISGQQWVQLGCDAPGATGQLTLVLEAVSYKNNLFTIVYASSTTSFDSNNALYFMPMEQSFQFLG